MTLTDAIDKTAQADALASTALKALHGDWASESSAPGRTIVAIPVSCQGVHHTLNVHVRDAGRIHAVSYMLLTGFVLNAECVDACARL